MRVVQPVPLGGTASPIAPGRVDLRSSRPQCTSLSRSSGGSRAPREGIRLEHVLDSAVSTSLDGQPIVHAVMSKWSQRPGRGIIFDFNGTLSNDEPILEQIFTGLFRDHLGWAMSAHEYTTHLLGRSDREIVEFAVREHGSGKVSLVERLLTLRSEEYREIVAIESPITSGVLDLVRLLHDAAVPMAIVTGAQRADVRAVLNNSEVGAMIPVLVAEEDVTHGKPDPEGFLMAAGLLGLQPADLLVFEDSIPGAAAAANAKMTCIAVSDVPSGALTSTVAAHVTTLDSRILTNVVL